MATRELIEAKLNAARAIVQRKIDAASFAATVDEFERNFRGTPDQDLNAAIDRWIGSFDGDCFAMPSTGQVWTHLKAIRSAGDDREAVGREFQRPRPEFMEGMRKVWEANGWVAPNRRGQRLATPRIGMNLNESVHRQGVIHEHVDRHPETNRWGSWVELADGTDEWKHCPSCAVKDRRQAEIDKNLGQMPEARTSFSACERGGRCDGSGWVDAGDSVRRCPACNPDKSLTPRTEPIQSES